MIEATTPIIAPSCKIDASIIEELLPQTEEQRIVIVHCCYHNKLGKRMRIWNSTVLIDKDSGYKSKLLHAENIANAPQWKPIELGAMVRFTLIFSALPKTCRVFDLIEEYPEHGCFYRNNIGRNDDDVYNVTIENTPINFWH